MRHSRNIEFTAALSEAVNQPARTRWGEIAADPNSAAALAARAETLRAAWRPAVDDRTSFLVDKCRGKVVLDIGCVAHDEARMSSDRWLHSSLARSASRCVGLDVLEDGVAAMNARGYAAIAHDMRLGLGPLESLGPFDVIVAGELIEHLSELESLFLTAAQILRPDGHLLITTPNPYSPARVRAGRRGIVWENVDHVLYAFPSGIAELAERYGLVLAEAMTTLDRPKANLRAKYGRVRRWIRGTSWAAVGLTTTSARRQRRVKPGPSRRGPRLRRTSTPRFDGETFIYVIKMTT